MKETPLPSHVESKQREDTIKRKGVIPQGLFTGVKVEVAWNKSLKRVSGAGVSVYQTKMKNVGMEELALHSYDILNLQF